MPGVSMKTIWQSGLLKMPLMTFLVVCGFGETIDIFSPVILLSSVDFPAFGLPIIDMKPDLKAIFRPFRFTPRKPIDSRVFRIALR
jgi:hypothetical protein